MVFGRTEKDQDVVACHIAKPKIISDVDITDRSITVEGLRASRAPFFKKIQPELHLLSFGEYLLQCCTGVICCRQDEIGPLVCNISQGCSKLNEMIGATDRIAAILETL